MRQRVASVTIWYDLTDLRDWTRPHLTGIQRTTVGILNGLVALGQKPRLTAFDERVGCFQELSPADLPAAVRCHLTWLAGPPAAPMADWEVVADSEGELESEPESCRDAESATAKPVAPPARRPRLLSSRKILGKSGEAEALRVALREHKAALKQLLRQTCCWARTRAWETVRRRRPPPAPAAPAVAKHDTGQSPLTSLPIVQAQPWPQRPAPGPFAAGDVLVSLGASWVFPGHAPAVARARASGVLAVRMIYDLIPTLKPQWVDDIDAQVLFSRSFTQWVRRLLGESDHLLTISEFSRSEIEQYCRRSGLVAAEVSVVRLGDVLEATGVSPPPPRFVPHRPFFLCVSAIDIRKNHRLLYEAWSQLAAEDPAGCPDLVCVGLAHHNVCDLVREIRNDPAVWARFHILADVSDPELAWYYRHCTATVYPSRYEGWGLPVAESLGHGRLCLASRATSIPEISPDLPEFFDPLDLDGLLRLVRRTLADPDWVRDREAEIHRRFVPTPWTHTAGQVLDAVAAATGAAAARRPA
jgi:glycosyltransferase involved in cell wall biosynthesis